MLVIGTITFIRIRSAEKIVLSYSPPDTLTAFWKPVTDSPSPILTSVGTVSSLHPASSPAEPTPEMGLLEAVWRLPMCPPGKENLAKIEAVMEAAGLLRKVPVAG